MQQRDGNAPKFHYRFSAFRSFFAFLSEVAEVGEGTEVPDLQLGKKGQ